MMLHASLPHNERILDLEKLPYTSTPCSILSSMLDKRLVSM